MEGEQLLGRKISLKGEQVRTLDGSLTAFNREGVALRHTHRRRRRMNDNWPVLRSAGR